MDFNGFRRISINFYKLYGKSMIMSKRSPNVRQTVSLFMDIHINLC